MIRACIALDREGPIEFIRLACRGRRPLRGADSAEAKQIVLAQCVLRLASTSPLRAPRECSDPAAVMPAVQARAALDGTRRGCNG